MAGEKELNLGDPRVRPDSPRSLTYRIARGVNRAFGNPLRLDIPEPPVQAKGEPEPKGRVGDSLIGLIRSHWEDFFELAGTRNKRYRDYNRMDEGDVAAMLDSVVDACTVSDDGRLFGFRVEAGKKVKNLLEATSHRLALPFIVRETLRDTLKYGDDFVALTVNNNGDVTYLQPLPVGQMLARTDEHNRLLRGTEGFMEGGEIVEYPAAYWQVNQMGKPLAGWYAWEMCHVKLFPTRKSAYSRTAFIESIRLRWHKLRMMEEGLVIARMVRAYLRYIHYLDTTGKDTAEAEDFITKYMDRVTKTKLAADETTGSRQAERRTLGVEEDLFMGTGWMTAPDGTTQENRSRIDVIDPQNTGLRYIPDVEYLQRGLFTRISGEIVGIPGDREDVSQQDIASSRFYQYCQKQVMEAQLLRPIFNLTLRLKGYEPNDDAYKITWPNAIIQTSWRFADATFRRSMADNNRIEGGIVSRKRIAQDVFGFTDEEWENEKEEIKGEMDELGPIQRGTKAQLTRVGNQAT